VPGELLEQLHPLEIKALPHLKDKITLAELAQAANLQEVEASRAIQWLENKGALTVSVATIPSFSIDMNGEKALERGMPEARLLRALQEGKKQEELAQAAQLSPEEMGAVIGILKKRDLIQIDKGNAISLTKKGKAHDAGKDPEHAVLRKIAQGIALSPADLDVANALRNRKLYVIAKERNERKVTLTDLGKRLAKTDTSKLDFAERLTREDLESGAWKSKRYRAFDVTAPVPHAYGGKIHFVEEAIEYVRSIWIEMGFTEHTGAIVQTAFWDLDALFVPQDHPAREMQDTFYLERPSRGAIPKAVFERVREAHENGGRTGSVGWRYRYSREEAERLLLMTHDTVLSAHTLWAIHEGRAAMPGKYFAVRRVFRNEKVDWKHLFEFHQVGGIVVDKDVTFAHLLGYLKIFFAKMGFPDIRTRPSHFPYTEPSVEVDVWHPIRKQWVELGGAGVFRPEVTKTLIGEEIPVLAWGLGLERIIVEFFGLQDLRDLYRNDIKQLQQMRRFFKPGAEQVR
jgi:phenylalanyl-tRNA synthetase alpha chain